MFTRLFALALFALAASGAGAQTSVPAPIEGDPADIDRFAGEWVGGYTCAETGRHGTIVFRLEPGADSVRAVVLMVPRATDETLLPDAVPLAIHHVEVTSRSLRGVLVRYEDPEFEVPLETTFGGSLDGDRHIEGYFCGDGTRIDTPRQCGRWWATRATDRRIVTR